MALPIDIKGPVLAEVFTVALDGRGIVLTGPCGAAPWYIEVHDGEEPLEVVRRTIEGELKGVLLLHSTSWHWERNAVTLSFVVVMAAEGIGSMDAIPVARTNLARGSSTEAPSTIQSQQILEHGLRHLAWLAKEDEVVRTTLSKAWHHVLKGYVPEPFRQLQNGG